jgi:hypothetical protein
LSLCPIGSRCSLTNGRQQARTEHLDSTPDLRDSWELLPHLAVIGLQEHSDECRMRSQDNMTQLKSEAICIFRGKPYVKESI